jgi:hypothetical protein|uniref:Uncharacterized protein n=1 Tax=Eutreptiella gymnastica TaxID=73025 RepID=A0A7S4LG63_9EUGL|mmetsp:Transcript_21088/g.33454  ORF Transcript_21088/g.33454 Transcript_21088/m.33454 type:complete len:144 (-) Transcript_21088:264-695(-)
MSRGLTCSLVWQHKTDKGSVITPKGWFVQTLTHTELEGVLALPKAQSHSAALTSHSLCNVGQRHGPKEFEGHESQGSWHRESLCVVADQVQSGRMQGASWLERRGLWHVPFNIIVVCKTGGRTPQDNNVTNGPSLCWGYAAGL